jgi:tripartite-type tricarboxylate transporter receptor subunit TctC
VVNPSFPAKTLPEFISYAKSNPGRLNFGTGGVGSVNHAAGELFKKMTGVDMTHVPYRGAGPALTDLIGGQIQVMFPGMASVIEHIRSGKLRALAVTTSVRSELLPDIPAVAESVPGYEVVQIYGIGAPRKMNAMQSESETGPM